MLKAFIALLATLARANTQADDTQGVFGSENEWQTGFIDIDSEGSDMFYWLIKSRREPSSDPLVLWMTGGPGCSSEVGIFYENGPWRFKGGGVDGKDGDEVTLVKNPHSWNNVANMLFVDNPIGTGYSNSKKKNFVDSEDTLSAQMGIFLKKFLAENPEFAGRDFYVTGESYAGRYVPAVTHYLLFEATDIDLNLKGMSIGNGDTDPYSAESFYAQFAIENGLTDKTMEELKADVEKCSADLSEAEQSQDMEFAQKALQQCADLDKSLRGNKWNMFDIRLPCKNETLCYDFSQSEKFLNRQDVQEILGVSGKWQVCEWDVHEFLQKKDSPVTQMSNVVDILDNGDIEVFIYYGDKDWTCNWRGGEAWTSAAGWSHQQEFNETPYVPLKLNGEDVGEVRQFGNLHFMKVYDSGHMVPMDQPEASLEIFKRFLDDDWSLDDGKAEKKATLAQVQLQHILETIF